MNSGKAERPPETPNCAQLQLLCNENAVLSRALAAAQQRAASLLAEKEAEITNLCTLLMQTQARNIGLETENEALRSRLGAMPAQEYQSEALRRLAHQSLYQEERISRLQREIERLRIATPPAARSMQAEASTLDAKRILCVGTHRKGVETYRPLIEAAGGQLNHHEGAEEHLLPQLDAALCAADLVICQTGCISHNAYWRVKEHCQLRGKRCVFVDANGTNGLAQGLRELLKDALANGKKGVQNGATGIRQKDLPASNTPTGEPP
jgi:hypothetical protein